MCRRFRLCGTGTQTAFTFISGWKWSISRTISTGSPRIVRAWAWTEQVVGVTKGPVGTAMGLQSGQIVFQRNVQPRGGFADLTAGLFGGGIKFGPPVQKEVRVGKVKIAPRLQTRRDLFRIMPQVEVRAGTAKVDARLVGGVVVTAEDEIFDAQPLHLFPEPAQIGREILRLEADADVEFVGIFLPQPAQGQDVIVQLGGQHPDAADEARRRVPRRPAGTSVPQRRGWTSPSSTTWPD